MDVIKELQEHEEKETLKKKKSKLNHIPKKSKKKIKEIIEEKIKHNEKISSKLINSLDEWKPPKEPKKDQKVSEGWFAKSYINKKYEVIFLNKSFQK